MPARYKGCKKQQDIKSRKNYTNHVSNELQLVQGVVLVTTGELAQLASSANAGTLGTVAPSPAIGRFYDRKKI